jgi:hypothetical protein
MSRQSRIESYSRPASKEWWDGRSSKKENLDRFSERARENTTGHKFRAKGGEIDLPPTGNVDLHSTHVRPGDGNDARAKAKADLNHDPVATLYAKGIRRNA